MEMKTDVTRQIKMTSRSDLLHNSSVQFSIASIGTLW